MNAGAARKARESFAIFDACLVHFLPGVLTGLLPPASTVMRPVQQHGCQKGFTHVLVWWMATLCTGRPAPRSGGWLCRKACQKGKSNPVPGADYRPNHRRFVLGAGLVSEPGALQRLRQSPAARPQ